MHYESGNRYKVSMGPVEEANFRGELYYTYYKFNGVSSGSYVDIAIEVGALNMFIVSRSFSVSTDRMELDVYAMPTYTGGTDLPITPYNSITPVSPAATTGVVNPAVTSTGTLFDQFLFLGSPDNNASRVAGSFRSNEVLRMIPPNTTFLLRFRNEGTVTMDGVVKYLFFERDPEIPLS